MEVLVYFFTFYTLVKIYVSVMQIGFIDKEMQKAPILMEQKEYLKAGRYAIKKERLGIAEGFLEFFLFIFWLGYGMGFLNSFFSNGHDPLNTVFIVISFLLVTSFVSLPFDIYKSFFLDKEFGFSTITPKLFVLDLLKSLLMLLVLGGAVLYILALIIESTQAWWFYAFLFVFALIIFINMLYPTLIAPIFNKFKPLENSELETEIDALMARSGFQSSGVFVIDSSKRDTRLNAYFGGLGKNKRVVLFDSLLEKLTSKELLAVLGHELGHFKHGDIYKGIALQGIMIFIVFALFGNIPLEVFESLGIRNDSAMNLLFILLLASPLAMFFMPIVGYFSRKNEYAADNYGSKSVDNASLISALLKLIKENSAFPKSHPFYIFFHYTHPPILERLKALGYED